MLKKGSTVDRRYRIDAQIEEGGMGIVYRAFDTVLEKTVALKTLLPQLRRDLRSQKELKREVALCQELSHPNIVRIHDLAPRARKPYLTMEYVDGITLEQYLGHKDKLSVKEMLSLARPILSAISYAHSKGVVHRDIKPQNIMINRSGVVKVMDFGIAQVLKDTYTKLTGKYLTGTPQYMSPEHISGRPPDVRSDVYSLGCLFYELLDGKPPFWTGEIIYQQLNISPLPVKGVPDRMNKIIMKCLEKEPTDRYQSVGELAKALLGKRAKQHSFRAEGLKTKHKPGRGFLSPAPPARDAMVFSRKPEKVKVSQAPRGSNIRRPKRRLKKQRIKVRRRRGVVAAFWLLFLVLVILVAITASLLISKPWEHRGDGEPIDKPDASGRAESVEKYDS